jgi:hypothetical protein
MTQHNPGLPKPIPVKATFVYNPLKAPGSSGHAGKKTTGKDLRTKPGKNSGR